MKRRLIVLLVILGVLLLGCGGGGESLTADAGPDFSVSVGQSPTFDGCGSTGDIVNYKWTIMEAPEGMSADAGKVLREVDRNCSFTLESAMGLQEVGQWDIQLEVRDAEGSMDTDTVTVTVTE